MGTQRPCSRVPNVVTGEQDSDRGVRQSKVPQGLEEGAKCAQGAQEGWTMDVKSELGSDRQAGRARLGSGHSQQRKLSPWAASEGQQETLTLGAQYMITNWRESRTLPLWMWYVTYILMKFLQ